MRTSNETLERVQDIVNQTPEYGVVVSRKDFKQTMIDGVYKECKYLICTNYKCLEPYHDNQRMELLGLYGTLWCGMQTADFKLVSGDDLEEALETAYVEAASKCDHTYGRELGQSECREKGIGHYGSCWHVYECGKCHTHFSVDSSD